MRNQLAALAIFALAVFAIAARAAFAQVALPDAKQVTLEAPIESVTLYLNRAMVTRGCALPDEQGTYEIRIEGLPPSIDAGSLSARTEGAKLLDVRFEAKTVAVDPSTNQELRAAIAALEANQRAAELLALRMAKVNDQNNLLNAIASKTATESAKDFGSKSLDPEALAKQVAFLDESREKLITQRTELEAAQRANADQAKVLQAKVNELGGKTDVARAAVVSVGKSQRGAARLLVNYLVSDAGWAPEYAIRAVDAGDDATDALTVEFNAEIRQRSGEDWSDISLTLSTAEPTRRPAPPEIGSEYLDILPPPVAAGEKLAEDKVAYKSASKDRARKAPGRPGGAPAPSSGGVGGGGGGFTGGWGDDGIEEAESIALGVELERTYADAAAEGGAVVNYPIPRKVTVPSDASRTRSQRVATIDLKPEFSHVARPIVDPTVYLRAKARNSSSYRLISGRARIFVGDDSVGQITLPTVTPGAEVVFWLGGDPRIESRRTLVAKETREQGVFGKSSVTTWKWRIDIVSAAPGVTTLEIADRMPVSRNEQIKVELKDLSLSLSTDEKYLKDERVRGILRWTLDLPGRGKDGKPTERSISWTVQESHPTEVAVGSSGSAMP